MMRKVVWCKENNFICDRRGIFWELKVIQVLSGISCGFRNLCWRNQYEFINMSICLNKPSNQEGSPATMTYQKRIICNRKLLKCLFSIRYILDSRKLAYRAQLHRTPFRRVFRQANSSSDVPLEWRFFHQVDNRVEWLLDRSVISYHYYTHWQLLNSLL